MSWRAWDLHPSVLIIAAIVVGFYLINIRRPGMLIGQTMPRWQRVAFFLAGATLIFLGLTSPLDAGAHRLLSFHMLQHVVLTVIGPPLVLLGLPPALLRDLIGNGRLFRLLQTLTQPFVAASLFIVNMWAWHVPLAYEAALDHLPVHIAMHVAFLATGLLFWWPAIEPLPAVSRFGGASRLLYLFMTGFPMGVLALLLLSAPTPIYSFYENAPRLWGVSPLTDQQVAGVIMGSLGEAATFITFSILFYKVMLGGEEDAALPRSPAQ